MRTLRFVGLDDSGTRLLFRAEDDQEHAVEVDDRLVQAVRRTHGWPRQSEPAHSNGQADLPVNTQIDDLRPREIQARVRAGESPAQIAASAGVEIERVIRFARPVLQEREHVAAAAQNVVVRTGALDGPLGEVVADRIAHVVPDTDTAWDAWRREDGRWTVALTFRDDVQERVARWSFDPTTNSVTVDDETARWLTEGTSTQAPQMAPAAPAQTTRARRLLSVPDLEPQPAEPTDEADLDVPEDDDRVIDARFVAGAPAGDERDEDDDDLNDDDLDDEDTIAEELAALGLQAITSRARALGVLQDADDDSEDEDSDTQTELDLAATEHQVEPEQSPAAEQNTEPEPEPEPAAKPAAKAKKSRKQAKRASVPSWDDIVFGARKQD